MIRFLYRLLLLAYPPDLRREFGDEMWSAVDAGWREARARGAVARLRFLGRVISDWFRSVWLVRRRDGARRRRASGGGVGGGVTEGWVRDFRFAARALWHDRGTTAAVVLTMALATGGAAFMFAVVHTVVLKPLPFATPDRLVAIWEHHVPQQQPRNVVSPANFHEWRDRAVSFDQLAAIIDSEGALVGEGPAEQVAIAYGSWNLFDLLGVRPVEGRGYTPADSESNAARKALLSWELWQRKFRGDRAVIGRTIRLADEVVEVIGVLPRTFRLPGHRADVWWQIRYSAAQRVPRGRSWQVIGRLKAGVTVAEARAEMAAIATALQAKYPDFDTGWRVTVNALGDDLSGGVRTPMLLMLAAAVILMVVACANTLNLLLARASRRRRDVAVRTALGATRWDLVRQYLAEGVVLAVSGVGGGMCVAEIALASLGRYSEALGIPRLGEATLGPTVWAAAAVATAAFAATFSVASATMARIGVPAGQLSGGGRWSSGSRRDRRMRHVLVVAQVAGAVVLVVGGGMAAQSVSRLLKVDPGFDARVFSFGVALPSTKYSAPGATMRAFDDLVDRLRSQPGIVAAGYGGFLPFSGAGMATMFRRADGPPPAKGTEPVADIRPVDEHYFSVMNLKVLAGRGFAPEEVRSAQRVCVISQSTALSVFGTIDVTGQWLYVELDGGPDLIVGVVSDVHHTSLASAPRPTIYYPFGLFPLDGVSVVLRGALDDRDMRAVSEAAVRQLDPDVPVTQPVRMQVLIDDSVASPVVAARLVVAFAALSLLLSLVGVAALLMAVVAVRRAEFGIRLALGATPSGLRRMVLREGLVLVGAGVGLGGAVAAAGAAAFASVLFDVRPLEPLAWAGAVAGMVLLGLAAADLPARRAARVDPVETFRP